MLLKKYDVDEVSSKGDGIRSCASCSFVCGWIVGYAQYMFSADQQDGL